MLLEFLFIRNILLAAGYINLYSNVINYIYYIIKYNCEPLCV